jgi:thiosulfate/3-mercaptopyruvate sulfurtransferase
MPALVSTGWLAAQVHAPDLVVVDASVDKIATPGGGYTWDAARSAFERDGHVAGARFADLVRDFSEPDASFPFTKPRIDRMASAVARWGISNGTRIVLYDRANGSGRAAMVVAQSFRA